MYCRAAQAAAGKMNNNMIPDILYEDNHIIVANKPPGMLSQGDDTGDLDLLSYLKGYVKDKYNKPGDAYIGLVHRLDRPVGGLMVFARTSKAASRLSNQVATQKMKKEYVCVCEGTPPDGKWVHWLQKDKRTNTTTVMRGRRARCKKGEPRVPSAAFRR